MSENVAGEYEPSTSRVRNAYIHGIGGMTWYEGKAEELGAGFDHWLESVLHKAQIAERERIIKILESEAIDVHEDFWIHLVDVIATIELIKGEQE